MNIQNLVLDINKKPFQTITANTGEVASRFVRISIVDKSIPVDLTGVTVSLYAKKPDGSKVFNNVTIEDKTNGIILAELTSQILAVEGLVKLTLLLVKNGGKLCSKQFLLNVDSSIVDDEAIESTNEFTALVDALGRVNNIDSRFENVSSQLEHKVNKSKLTIYLDEYAKENNIEINKINDISELLQYCVDNYKNIIMPIGYDYRISKSVYISKNCNIYCEGEIFIDDNVTAFIIGGFDNSERIERNKFKINKVWGNGKSRNSILFSLRHAVCNQFIVNYAENIGKVIELKPISKNCSLGENQFKLHLWYGCDIAFHIMGADTWENRTWAEGSQILNGFISGCNYGVKIEKNVLYSGMLITCGIDNMEIPNSWDYYNGGNESPDYQIANLLLFRFIRFNNCKFRNIDSFWDSNLKLKTTGEIQAHGALRQEGIEGNFRINNGQAEIFNPNIVYFDFKNNIEDDYNVRMSLQNKKMLFESKTSPAFEIEEGGFKLSRSGINISVPLDSNNIVINHKYTMPSTNYSVICIPNWNTSYYLEVKNSVGFKLVFSENAPKNATIDYFIIFGEE